jgi:hypothetical protein
MEYVDIKEVTRRMYGTWRTKRSGNQRRRTFDQEWSEEEEQAFYTVRELGANASMLVHPDWNRPFVIANDASTNGVGPVLYQRALWMRVQQLRKSSLFGCTVSGCMSGAMRGALQTRTVGVDPRITGP